MAVESLAPGGYSAPAPLYGGIACAGDSQGATCSPTSPCQSAALGRATGQWGAFPAPQHQIAPWTSATLSASWSYAADSNPGDCQTTEFDLLYTLDGTGTNWISFPGFPRPIMAGNSGVASVDISPTQNVANVAVRVVTGVTATQGDTCFGNFAWTCAPIANVSTIRITAQYAGAGEGVGGCCNGSSCTITTQAACTGTYRGNGTDCNTPCSTANGACCFPGNDCNDTLISQNACTNLGGTWMGYGSICVTNMCLNMGGCCRADKSCWNPPEAQCVGKFLGTNNFCAAGACTKNRIMVCP